MSSDDITNSSPLFTDATTVDQLLRELEFGEQQEESSDGESSDASRIYSHGYSLRVRLLVANPDAALAELGWPDTKKSKRWIACITKAASRWILRGTTFITQRKPQNLNLPMARLNKECGTALYSVQIEQPKTGNATFVDLHGVRVGDVDTLLQQVMRLKPSEYKIEYYRALERYIVLAPAEALALAEKLGGTSTQGKGRAKRKQYLVKDLMVPITLRKRSRQKASVNVYRISRGATAQFKVEVRVAGKRSARSHFSEADIEKLDAVLNSLIDDNQLHPVPKPARWEPRGKNIARRDTRLENLPAAAYRGRKLSQSAIQRVQRIVAECNTPLPGFFLNSPSDCDDLEHAARIREKIDESQRKEVVWKKMATDIEKYPGYLSEVLLNPNQDPVPLIEAIIKTSKATIASQVPEGALGAINVYSSIQDQQEDGTELVSVPSIMNSVDSMDPVSELGSDSLARSAPAMAPSSVAVAIVGYGDDSGPRTWRSVTELAAVYPWTDRTTTLVVVIDPEVYCAVADGICAVKDEKLVDGPLVASNWHPGADMMALYAKATAALAFELLASVRIYCEATGLRVVLVSVDNRPDHGRGPLQRSHRFRDGRVRSLLGDAGRYNCHLRYLVENGPSGAPRSAVLVKDEGDGQMGRIL